MFNLPKEHVLKQSIDWWNPGKTRQWQEDGIDFVMGKREGYYVYDMHGKRLMNLHLNGGTFNLGHRNPEIIETLTEALDYFDLGNHHFPSIGRAKLSEALAKTTPDSVRYSIFASGGSEAIDAAIKCSRYATKRKKVVSIQNGYHGHSGLAVSLGHVRYSGPFLSEGEPGLFIQVPFNDLDAMESALKEENVACVVIETVPATYGFPMPNPRYLKRVKELCERYGTLYVADEVQTGLMRSGKMWGIEHYSVQPDILVTAKGLSGGIYPIAATIVSEQAGGWMHEDGLAHISTFGGSELGCIVASKVLEISSRPEVIKNVEYVSRYLRTGLERIKETYSDYFVGIRQLGVIMGLEFREKDSAKDVMRELYKNGVWAIYSMLDTKVLQFKPGLLLDKEYCDDLLERCEKSIKEAASNR
ncbi:class-III pyridoxal-phosphate-dependent aminotransferase [Bacillus sp. FJAT-45350]|uniref:class-III pyridoxal-phosphate-dependent aminotransferase n=1 Tax=Bacillus sp. FJAT-45350 TaxID=2011014 RepID=UPI00211BC3E8|nr:aminotransferase class III-fold pyridoxal phosphate-dependent enzyme [Bacillus sp. FJAT-45350]